MSDVIFDEEQKSRQSVEMLGRSPGGGATKREETTFFTNLLFKLGLAKNKRTAQIILFAFAIVMFGFSIYIYMSQASATGDTVIYKEDIPPQTLERLPRDMVSQMPSRKDTLR